MRPYDARLLQVRSRLRCYSKALCTDVTFCKHSPVRRQASVKRTTYPPPKVAQFSPAFLVLRNLSPSPRDTANTKLGSDTIECSWASAKQAVDHPGTESLTECGVHHLLLRHGQPGVSSRGFSSSQHLIDLASRCKAVPAHLNWPASSSPQIKNGQPHCLIGQAGPRRRLNSCSKADVAGASRSCPRPVRPHRPWRYTACGGIKPAWPLSSSEASSSVCSRSNCGYTIEAIATCSDVTFNKAQTSIFQVSHFTGPVCNCAPELDDFGRQHEQTTSSAILSSPRDHGGRSGERRRDRERDFHLNTEQTAMHKGLHNGTGHLDPTMDR